MNIHLPHCLATSSGAHTAQTCCIIVFFHFFSYCICFSFPLTAAVCICSFVKSDQIRQVVKLLLGCWLLPYHICLWGAICSYTVHTTLPLKRLWVGRIKKKKTYLLMFINTVIL